VRSLLEEEIPGGKKTQTEEILKVCDVHSLRSLYFLIRTFPKAALCNHIMGAQQLTLLHRVLLQLDDAQHCLTTIRYILLKCTEPVIEINVGFFVDTS
jgi:hypothetical protein